MNVKSTVSLFIYYGAFARHAELYSHASYIFTHSLELMKFLCLFIVFFHHVLVIFCRLYGFPSWKLSWPLNESVKTRPVHILLVRKMSFTVFVMCRRGNCLTREEFALFFVSYFYAL